jgi:hypothetical protein
VPGGAVALMQVRAALGPVPAVALLAVALLAVALMEGWPEALLVHRAVEVQAPSPLQGVVAA